MSGIRRLKAITLCVAGLAAANPYFVAEVRAQSPWKPDKPVEIVLPTGAGGTNDQMARLIQKALQDQKLVTVPTLVMNKAGGNQSLAVVYLNMVSSVSAALPQVEAGNARILGIAAPKRQPGKLAQVPTMREEGMNATGIPNWRGIMGAKGITAEQSAFWSRAFAKVATTDEWLQQLEKNNVAPLYLAGDDLNKWLAPAYEDTRSVMADLGLVK